MEDNIKYHIVAIDIGTSHIAGVVGRKYEDGTYSIVAHGSESSISCVRRGNIYNLEETADIINKLIKSLEDQLNGGVIDKFYIGTGGQSLCASDHIEHKKIKKGTVITEDILIALCEQCEKNKIGSLRMIDIAQAIYYIDKQKEAFPVGLSGEKIEGHYKLVFCRESVCYNIENCIQKIENKNIAGILATPQALADAILSDKDKEPGCALIDFGAGVTNISVYKNGELLQMATIPLGSNLITKDLISLGITRTKAERLKIESGCAMPNEKDDDKTIDVDMDGLKCTISTKEFNAIVHARATEIVENIYTRINEVAKVKSLGAGIFIAGCGANMKGFQELIKEKCKVRVRRANIKQGLIRNQPEIIKDPIYMNSISLILKGAESCVTLPEPIEKVINKEDLPVIKTPSGPNNNTQKEGFGVRLKKALEKIIEETTIEN